jgi:cytochrome oxidase Cu insertion factor (SCO1/SenC/PrrC family)
MKRLTAYILLVVALALGVGLGFGGARLFGLSKAGEVHNARLEVGDAAPDFRLPDHTGGYVRLSDFRGDSNVVLAFYPAAWTPV